MTRKLYQDLDDQIRSGVRLSLAQRLRLRLLLFEVDFAELVHGATAALSDSTLRHVRLSSIWSLLALGLGIIMVLGASLSDYLSSFARAAISLDLILLALTVGVVSTIAFWSPAVFNRLGVVGNLIDPAREFRPRLVWSLAFALYSVVGAVAVYLQLMTSVVMIFGVFILLGLLLGALAAGAVLPRCQHVHTTTLPR